MLEIGEVAGKMICIDSDEVSNETRSKIKEFSKVIDNLSLDGKIGWFKQYCPWVMRGYRTLLMSKMSILKEYQI